MERDRARLCAEGIDVRPVGDLAVLKQTALVEAFSLKVWTREREGKGGREMEGERQRRKAGSVGGEREKGRKFIWH